MSGFIKNIFCIALVFLVGSYSSSALAEKGGKQKNWNHSGKYDDENHHKEKGKGKHNRYHADDKVAVFLDSDRIVIRDYLRRYHGSACPPGLAKKRNGCLPPGQAKKLYRVGYPLEVEWYDVPGALLDRLHPVPAGYRYVMVDKDVLLISEASKKVIDAVTLLSAVGH